MNRFLYTRVELTQLSIQLTESMAHLRRTVCRLIYDEQRLVTKYRDLAVLVEPGAQGAGVSESTLDSLQAATICGRDKRKIFEKAIQSSRRDACDFRRSVQKEIRLLDKQAASLQKRAAEIPSDTPDAAGLVLPAVRARREFWEGTLVWLDAMDGALHQLSTGGAEFFRRLSVRGELLTHVIANFTLPLAEYSSLLPAIDHLLRARNDRQLFLEVPLAAVQAVEEAAPWSLRGVAQTREITDPSVAEPEWEEEEPDRHRLDPYFQPYALRAGAEFAVG